MNSVVEALGENSECENQFLALDPGGAVGDWVRCGRCWLVLDESLGCSPDAATERCRASGAHNDLTVKADIRSQDEVGQLAATST